MAALVIGGSCSDLLELDPVAELAGKVPVVTRDQAPADVAGELHRVPRLEDAVFEAILALLERKGFSGMTVKEIADDAGVAETTIYRRWGSITRLVTEALSAYAVTENPIPDTGRLKGT